MPDFDKVALGWLGHAPVMRPPSPWIEHIHFYSDDLREITCSSREFSPDSDIIIARGRKRDWLIDAESGFMFPETTAEGIPTTDLALTTIDGWSAVLIPTIDETRELGLLILPGADSQSWALADSNSVFKLFEHPAAHTLKWGFSPNGRTLIKTVAGAFSTYSRALL